MPAPRDRPSRAGSGLPKLKDRLSPLQPISMIPHPKCSFWRGKSMAASRRVLPGAGLMLGILFLAGCRGLVSGGGPGPGGGSNVALTVTSAGSGSGTVTSTPAGINCPGTCTANFASGTQVTLTATPGTSFTFRRLERRVQRDRRMHGHADRGGDGDGQLRRPPCSRSITSFS